MGSTRRQMLGEGAAAARPADAAARRQPDDPLRALDGRDRRPDRRRRPRRRRHERALHEPGARDPRRRRDRDHGDGARPRRPRRSPSAPTRPSVISTTRRAAAAPSSAARRVVAIGAAIVAVAKLARRLVASTRTRRRRRQVGDAPGVAARADPDGARLRAGPDVVGVPASPSRSATTSSRRCCCRSRASSSARPWFVTLGGLTLIAFVISGLRPAITTFADARLDRRHRRLGARDGHALAGARGDACSPSSSASLFGVLRGREQRRSRRLCGRSTTCCRRCRSSSTSSRSSI